jgi:hypothetical protein
MAVDRTDDLAVRVRDMFAASPEAARGRIESLLLQELQDLDPKARLEEARRIRSSLADAPPGSPGPLPEDSGVLGTLMSLLLGNRMPDQDLSSQEFLEQLGHSLNTLFDTLNELVQTVEHNLKGRQDESATIRTVIASEISGKGSARPLHEHLNQIKEAFLVAHKSFQESSAEVMREVLRALSPEKLESKAGGGLKFGALKKAELYDLYKAQYENIVMWFETGRYRDHLLREFEKSCQKDYQKHKGN